MCLISQNIQRIWMTFLEVCTEIFESLFLVHCNPCYIWSLLYQTLEHDMNHITHEDVWFSFQTYFEIFI